MSVKVRIIDTFVTDVIIHHTDDFTEAKQYIMNNRTSFGLVPAPEDWAYSEYEEVEEEDKDRL